MLLACLVTILAGYLIGSIPTGYLMGRARGIDLRSQGSGNIGATNALRILGKPAGIFVLIVDALKGYAGVTLVPQIGRIAGALPAAEMGDVLLPLLGGVSAVLGHNFTCWLRFRGGKGIATSAGVLAGLLPLPFLVVLGTFVGVLAVFRIVSLASVAAAAILPVATVYWHRDRALIGFSLALATLAIWRHRANLQRLMAGTEPRIGQKRVAVDSNRT